MVQSIPADFGFHNKQYHKQQPKIFFLTIIFKMRSIPLKSKEVFINLENKYIVQKLDASKRYS